MIWRVCSLLWNSLPHRSIHGGNLEMELKPEPPLGKPQKKLSFLVARPLRKKSQKNVATKLEGGGGKALVAGPLKKITFFAASLTY